MNRYLLNTIGVFLLGLISVAGWALWEWGIVGQQSQSVVQSAGPVISKFGGIEDGASTTLAVVNRPCGFVDPKRGLLPCGTLADINSALNSFRLATGQITALSLYERPQLEALNKQEAQLFEDAHSAITNFVIFEVSLNNTIQGVQPLESKLGIELDALHKTTLDADAVISDPELKQIILNAAGISGHLDGLTGDIQAKTHDLIYPAPCHGKICWVKRTYSIVKGVVQLGEPAYYWGALSTDVFK